MKNLNLNNFGVEEMNASELRTVEGGGPVNDLLGIVVGGTRTILKDTFEYVGKTATTLLQTIFSL
ncbi:MULTISPECIES: hypothetical protein [Olivibacter]|jgi:hypothetical protein|uniref:Bacteriocin n=3 Tax=Sphingobacteriaceae TaxID=84566 RepID=F4C8L8_SPHS2|nr:MULTISPECIES: hypothetical protein [Olivibacter]MCL4638458.1 hypothetical protein [Olivibacter sp. UJ_SKK_5.1]MDM8175822.1 hypothetical protein [Olivibacter sp. 47]MDX3914428.1 hypothetical protein [Pseudosphingobacterium sp.]QEL02550.1 hypothetical protein FKG96_17590 [Olivibacter sp. LS-1]